MKYNVDQKNKYEHVEFEDLSPMSLKMSNNPYKNNIY